MQLSQVSVKNFRLLRDVRLNIEPQTTLIVGRNNSGKTSLTELFRRLLSDPSPRFQLEDFSLGAHKDFWRAWQLYSTEAEVGDIRVALPAIELEFHFDYAGEESLGVLGEFVIDLDGDCTTAIARMRYELRSGKVDALFGGLALSSERDGDSSRVELLQGLRERIPRLFEINTDAIDPGDPQNQLAVDFSKLRELLQAGFISAQRGLDDTTHRERGVLGKVFEGLFRAASSDSAQGPDHKTALELEDAIRDIQEDINRGFNRQIEELLPAFSLFGYPGLSDPALHTETTLDVERLLANHTHVRYGEGSSISLPETYNGLGSRNLIYILLKLLEFFKSYKAAPKACGLCLVFIEEPESHLHPQMQEVFIRKLTEIAEQFAQEFDQGNPWPVQFVVTTHSSHMANEAPFESMRYFRRSATGKDQVGAETCVKDLRCGLQGSEKEDRKFLHQYMTLTRCDLLFADKAILIEGTTERLLLPEMIRKVSVEGGKNAELSSQYVSILEVGGAYAQKFFPLLDFLELPALVITDIDTVSAKKGKGCGKACLVAEGARTSNSCIRQWFGDPHIAPSELIDAGEVRKVIGERRIAYQVPESQGGPSGRSFEDALMIANAELFELEEYEKDKLAKEAYEQAKGVKKSEFALKYAIEEKDWCTPLYIAEGLEWLAKVQSSLDADGNTPEATAMSGSND